MPKKRRKVEDTNETALRVVAQATGEVTVPVIVALTKHKDPLAVELGRRGGLKGGAARAANLSPERKKEIAAKAAAARWGKRKK